MSWLKKTSKKEDKWIEIPLPKSKSSKKTEKEEEEE